MIRLDRAESVLESCEERTSYGVIRVCQAGPAHRDGQFQRVPRAGKVELQSDGLVVLWESENGAGRGPDDGVDLLGEVNGNG